ncbi:MAG: MFS transporter [Saprospiraceae bacterium]|nr:MFS transporter [Saprospiraceae bacterium]
MIQWYFKNFVNAPEKRSLLFLLGFLYSLDLINLLSWDFKPEYLGVHPNSIRWVFGSMLLGGLTFSWWVYHRKKRGKNLQHFLLISVIGQAIFMLGQGLAIQILESGWWFVFARCCWGFFFTASLGLIISTIMPRVYPRQRTWACAMISLTGLLTTSVFLSLLANVDSRVIEGNSHLIFYSFGVIGLFFALFFSKIPFGELIDGEEKEDFIEPKKLMNPKIFQTLLPLVGIGLFTYFVFDLLGLERRTNLEFNVDESMHYRNLAIRYTFTFLGTALSCWLSFITKRRDIVFWAFMGAQLISLCFFFYSPVKNDMLIIVTSAAFGFSTGIFLLAIITAAESFGNRLRPTATILLSSLFRGSALLTSLLLGTSLSFNDFWLGVAIIIFGMLSVLALDSSNFDGNADLKGFDLDIYNPDESKRFFKVFDGINPDEWLNPIQKIELLKECNKRILENLRPIFGDWIYHCVLYEYNEINHQLDAPEPQNNYKAWLGLKAGEPQFREYLSFARWMLMEGKMKSLIEASFEIKSGSPEGIILHNLKRKYTPPEGFACVDLAQIQLPKDDDGICTYLSLADEKLDKAQRLKMLETIENQVNFDETAFVSLQKFGFDETSIKGLHRTFIVRKIESLHMPGEYFLTLFFPKGGLKIALAILATNAKVQSKFLEINAMLSSFITIRGEKLYSKYLEESILEREVVLPGRRNVNITVRIRDVVSIEIHDGYSTLYFLNALGELMNQTINIDLQEILNRFFVQDIEAPRWIPGTLLKCHKRYFVNLQHNWEHRNPVGRNHHNRGLVNLVNGRQGHGGYLILRNTRQDLVVPISRRDTRNYILRIIRAE